MSFYVSLCLVTVSHMMDGMTDSYCAISKAYYGRSIQVLPCACSRCRLCARRHRRMPDYQFWFCRTFSPTVRPSCCTIQCKNALNCAHRLDGCMYVRPRSFGCNLVFWFWFRESRSGVIGLDNTMREIAVGTWVPRTRSGNGSRCHDLMTSLTARRRDAGVRAGLQVKPRIAHAKHQNS